jgi:lipopolysaccharide export LptBFGC system permease protein LptF
MCVLYLACIAFGLLMFFIRPSEEFPRGLLIVYGVLLVGMGLVFGVVYLISLFLDPRPWVWVCDLVLICVGFTSCCTLPACIPLLIYWIRPEVRKYFGRS